MNFRIININIVVHILPFEAGHLSTRNAKKKNNIKNTFKQRKLYF